ncbi:hypothetical protein NEMBOFW57_008008 [Staphylotrichum longicolle]|uniref:Lectin n=1 Tax=Staphylotrichum longicolle TaxID=669026 RepID=A0AAD4EQW9_9PEZI|nr:hypothetical protein NEMBOFW57_008008 [Staphylotrichum longicolle]
MTYTLQLRVINDTPDVIALVEQTCWSGAGTIWSATNDATQTHFPDTQIHQLQMDGSGSSGMLRFRASSSGTRFAVAVGVHNYKRWCDVQVDLADDQPLTRLHGAYYAEGDPKNAALWAQASEAAGTEAQSGRQVRVAFYKSEGERLLAVVTYA